jgi:hypothetical protein
MAERQLNPVSRAIDNGKLARKSKISWRARRRRLGFYHFAAAQARSAHAHALGRGAYAGVHGAQIYVPPPLGDVMGVADAVSRLRLLAADITLLSHDCELILFRSSTKLLFYRIHFYKPIRLNYFS